MTQSDFHVLKRVTIGLFDCRLVYFLLFLCISSCVQALPLIHVIGDSHSMELSQVPGTLIHWLGPITMHRVGRDGLGCVNLQTLGVQEGEVAIFAFGEIDVRCHIGKQRDEYRRNLNEIIETLATNYIQTILANRALYQKLLCVIYSITPPREGYRCPYFPYYGTIQDRVAITRKLNARLASLCSLVGIEFLDVYKDYATSKGTLKPEDCDANVHIEPSHNQPIIEKLNQILTKHQMF